MIVFVGRTDTDSPGERGDRLRELPPSAKLVFKVLEYDAALTQQEIASQTRLSTRTTRHALSKLKDADLVDEQVYVPDARKRIYEPLPVAEE